MLTLQNEFVSSKRANAYLALFLTSIFWGVAGPIIKFTLEGIDPFPFLAYRFTISAVIGILFFVVTKTKIKNPSKTIPLAALQGTLAFTIALGLLFTGLKNSTVLELSLIGTISPLLVMLGGAFFFRDHITKREKIGASIAFTGTLITVFSPILRNNEIAFSGNILLIIFLFADVGALLWGKQIMKKGMKPEVLSNIGLITAGLTMLTIAVYTQGAGFIEIILNLPLKYHLGVWYMAVVSGSIAYYLSVRAEKSIEISEAGLFWYLHPIFSVPLAIFWLGESITAYYIIGAILITIGVVIAEIKRRRTSKKSNPLAKYH